MPQDKNVLLGMSGGVDSTVAAILLQRQGYNVTGVYMQLHDNEAYHAANYTKACIVGEYLGIDVHYHDISDTFREEVVDYFVSSYKQGLTPNPCVVCNRQIKFGAMVEYADTLGIYHISTGHYLRSDGRFIYTAADPSKDQSYFLSVVRADVIPRLIFPLGDILKSETIAMAADIPILQEIAHQKESNEICFIENDDYTTMLAQYIDIDQPGEVIDTNGQVVGAHKGYAHYTIGKRRGFSVDGAHEPHYVLSLDPDHNRITVGTRDELYADSFGLRNINLFSNLNDFECTVKVRYRTQAIPARVTIHANEGFVQLHQPVFGLAQGQFAAFYDNDKLLGGGVITSTSQDHKKTS